VPSSNLIPLKDLLPDHLKYIDVIALGVKCVSFWFFMV
jgi:hypothetical protein